MPVYFPARDEFDSLAAEYPVVPVWRRVISDLETPVAAFMKLSGDGPAFLLESV
jgi:anthranilate synthase component 1